MKHESKLSEYVQDYITTLDWESERDVPPENRAENQRARKMIEVNS